jgi:L-alanine-DL-glutamate epimerase-like enolase superfamily enzyme
MKYSAHIEEWPLQAPFRITGKEWLSAEALVVELEGDGFVGRGEAQGIYYLDETPASMLREVDAIADRLRAGLTREELQQLLPRGGARNAVDCALWDWEAKQSGKTIWELLEIEPHPVTTVFTIGLEDTPEAMAQKAARAAVHPVLKVKLNADRPVKRLRAIREARPDAVIVVDANQAWDVEMLEQVVDGASDLSIGMIEQPLPRGNDSFPENFSSPIPIAADESCLDSDDFMSLDPAYSIVNIKLDKAGGLTEALRLAEAARSAGRDLMVGNMVGTSLAMAPAFVIAQMSRFVDLDGPLLLTHDRPHGIQYKRGEVSVFTPALWG